MSLLKSRIQTLEFNPSVLIPKLPIDGGVPVVPSGLPGRDFGLHLRHRVNPSV